MMTNGESHHHVLLDDAKVQDFAALLWMEVSAIREQLKVLKEGQESLVSGQHLLQNLVSSHAYTAPFSNEFTPAQVPNGCFADEIVDGECSEHSKLAFLPKTSTEELLETKEEAHEQMNERRKRRFKNIIRKHQEMDARAQKIKEEDEARRKAGYWQRFQALDRHGMETVIDSMTSVMIVMNALLIGASLDREGDEKQFDIYQFFNVFFAIFWLIELSIKLFIHGWWEFYFGRDRLSNRFDTLLIVLDCIFVLLALIVGSIKDTMEDSGFPAPSLFRVVRLVRLTRLIRLLRLSAFSDLLSMVGGLIGGALTLFWAVILLLLIVYVCALLCREIFGSTPHDEVYDYFKTVPRSMFTVFRCSFGDCSSRRGVPIPEYINIHYGWFASLLYCMFLFSVAIGLFNVISAIFVESTLSANAEATSKAKTTRFLDDELWADSVTTVLKEMLYTYPKYAYLAEGDWLQDLDLLLKIEFPRSILDDAVKSNRHVKEALKKLDIDSHEHHRLPDILDPDHSGSVNILELVSGLERLRGEPRRSDIIGIDLMVRSMQELLDDVLEKTIGLQKAAQEEMQQSTSCGSATLANFGRNPNHQNQMLARQESQENRICPVDRVSI